VFGQPQVPTVDTDDAATKLDSGALLIDVRDQAEWDEARIPGAVHKPIASINEWFGGLPSDRDIVFQCHSGGRSAQVVHALATQAGMSNVWNLAGGIVAWANAGKPVDDGPPGES
jgi:rhodanese-related sulfurtransferase